MECLVRLPEDRTRWGRRVSELMEEGKQNFVEQAVEVVGRQSLPPESGNALLRLLISKGYLLPVLQGVYTVDRIRFREVLSMVHAVEPRVHTRITKRLTELLGQDHQDRIEEVLCLFDSVVRMNGMANLAAALPLLKDAKEPRMRARAVLLGASLPNGRHLLELYRDERDPRVRVSILESLWLDDQPVARLVFEEARRDLQPRVRAYGLLGLYHLGDPRALTALAEMAESPQALSRAVARGAIELLHEPRFEPLLARLRAEFGAAPPKHEPISPAVRCGRRTIHLAVPRIQRLPSGRLNVQFSACLDAEEQLDPVLRPLDVRTWVDGQPVLSYSLVRAALSRRLGIGVVFPLSLRAASESTPGIRAVLDLLLSMPDGELRSAAFYRSGLFMRQAQSDSESSPSPSPAPLRLPIISQDGFRFAADLRDASREDNLAADPGELVLAMINRMKALKPAGHIGLMVNEAVKGPPKPSIVECLRQGLQESGCVLHVIALGQVVPEILDPWFVLSRDCRGFQTRISTEDELPEVIHAWMLCYRESYCLEFEAPASASRIRLQAVHPAGSGETTVPLEMEQTLQCARAG